MNSDKPQGPEGPDAPDSADAPATPGYLRKAMSDLYVFDKPVFNDGVYVFAAIECKEVMPGRAYLTLDTRTGLIALAQGCGCASTVNIGTLFVSLAARLGRAHAGVAADVAVH